MDKDSAKPGVGARSSPAEGRSQGFPKAMRLRTRSEFLSVQRTGRRFHGDHFFAVVRRRDSVRTADPAQDAVAERGRVGITVTKKVGNAVTRNRIKRLVREYVRKEAWLGIPMDTVFIAKQSAAGLAGYREVAEDLASIQEALVRARPWRDTPRDTSRRPGATRTGRRG